MCDLAHLFDVVMRTYQPAVTGAGKMQSGSSCACNAAAGPCGCRPEDLTACLPQLLLASLPADVQVRQTTIRVYGDLSSYLQPYTLVLRSSVMQYCWQGIHVSIGLHAVPALSHFRYLAASCA